MGYNPDIHHRRSIRKTGFDYTQPGAYFVTVCTQHRQCVLDDPVVANICVDVWLALPGWFPTIGLDDFTIMPNHSHFVVWLIVNPGDENGTKAVTESPLTLPSTPQIQIYGQSSVGAHPCGRPPTWDWVIPVPERIEEHPTLGAVVGAWKSLVTTVYLDWVKRHDPLRRAKFWQRNYYDHIIRNDRALSAIRQYIRNNPRNWGDDPDNPANRPGLPFPETVDDYINDIRRHT